MIHNAVLNEMLHMQGDELKTCGRVEMETFNMLIDIMSFLSNKTSLAATLFRWTVVIRSSEDMVGLPH